jgi:hypothetical protein
MKKQDISVGELVAMVERKELQLPQIQRKYVWPATRVRDLLDSLYRGYPSGTILVWETDQPVPSRALAVEQGSNAFEGQKLLLDGQQRLTSLTAVLTGKKVGVRGRRRPIDILFNLDHPEGIPSESAVDEEGEQPLILLGDEDDAGDEASADEQDAEGSDLLERLKQRTFVVASRSLKKDPNWVSVTQVFSGAEDAELLERTGVESFKDPRFKRYTSRLQRLRQIRNYPYVMHVLSRDLSYEEVTEIFVRVNSLGVKLRSSDLALAQITARWDKFLDLVEQYQAEFEEIGFVPDTGLLVRTMIVFATQQSKFQRAGSTSTAALKQGWEKAQRGLRFAINFLRNNAGIEDESLLSAPTIIVPIAVYSHLHGEKLTGEDERALLYWLHVANARGRYSRGSSETLLNEDLGILFRGGTPADLIEPIKRLFGRVEVLASDLAGRPARSPLFALAYLTLKARGAKDWQTGLGLSLSKAGRQHAIQFHHIFPKAVLKKAGLEGGEINEIANLAFVSGRTNQRLGTKSPADYFPGIIEQRGQQALASQLIPLDADLWRVENYRAFLEARRQMLADAINQHIRSALQT